MEINIFNTQNKYDLLYSDPPWNQKKGNKRKCRPNQNKELDYKVLELDEIKKIQEQASTLCNEVHNVFIWTIDKYLFEAEKMMEELGYKLHARLIWDKENGVAPAFTVRFSHEYLLWFYKKGCMLKPEPSTRGKFTTVLREAATIHSKKPECAYRMLEALFPSAKKLELFARNNRPGWDSWGDQVGLLDETVYRLTAIVSQNSKKEFTVCFESNDIYDVKTQADIKHIIPKACKYFNIKEGEMFVDYIIEENGEYYDSDTSFIEVRNNKIRTQPISA